MSASAYTVYSHFMDKVATKNVNLNADTFFMVLLTNSYTPAVSTDTLWSDISANEVGTGSGYTAGGQAVTGVSCTLTSNTETFTFTTPSWATFSATFRYLAIVRAANGSSVQSTDMLVCYCDATGGGSITGGGGTFTAPTNASGAFTFTHSP